MVILEKVAEREAWSGKRHDSMLVVSFRMAITQARQGKQAGRMLAPGQVQQLDIRLLPEVNQGTVALIPTNGVQR